MDWETTDKCEVDGSCLICGALFHALPVITGHQQVNVGPEDPEIAYAVNGTLFTSSSLIWLEHLVCLNTIDTYLNGETTQLPLQVHSTCLEIFDSVLERNRLPTTNHIAAPEHRTLHGHKKCGFIEGFYSKWFLKHKRRCIIKAKLKISGLPEGGLGVEYWGEKSALAFACPEPLSYSALRELDQYAQNKSILVALKQNEGKTDLTTVKALPYGQVPQLASSTVSTPYRLPHRGYADERTEIIDEVKTANQHKYINSPASGLLGLPNELIARITYYLPRATDVIRLHQVCQRLHDSITVGKQFWEHHIRTEFWFIEKRLLKLDPNYFANRDSVWLKYVYRCLRSDYLPAGIGSDLLWGVQSDPGLESLQWKNLKRIHACAEGLAEDIYADITRELEYWTDMGRRDSDGEGTGVNG